LQNASIQLTQAINRTESAGEPTDFDRAEVRAQRAAPQVHSNKPVLPADPNSARSNSTKTGDSIREVWHP